MELRTTRIELSVPAGAKGCEVTLAPTRSRIVCACVAEPAGGTACKLREGVYGLSWAPRGEVARAEFRVVYEGEPVRLLMQRYGNTSGMVITGTPTNADWSVIYQTRAGWDCPRQKFMFELDRQTNPNLLPLATDIPEAVKLERIGKLAALMGMLETRLAMRMRGDVRLAPAIQPEELLVHFSCVVHRATQAQGAGEDWSAIGSTLEEFAAGGLGKDVPVQRDGGALAIRQVEPDSYFIFYFAEFALAALDAPSCAAYHAMWSGLLPALVKCQRYFFRRFSGVQCLTQYGEPPAPLDATARARADAECAARGRGRADQEALMFENLEWAAGGCF